MAASGASSATGASGPGLATSPDGSTDSGTGRDRDAVVPTTTAADATEAGQPTRTTQAGQATRATEAGAGQGSEATRATEAGAGQGSEATRATAAAEAGAGAGAEAGPTRADEARVEVLGRLGPEELAAVTWLVEAATEADGVRPLSEHVALHLRYGGDAPVRNVLLWSGPDQGQLVAYAHLDVTDVVEGASAELVVAPEFRRRGYGRSLVEALLAETPDGRLRLWAHGAHPAASRLARRLGFEQMRELWQMRRSLFSRLPDMQPPTGIAVRTFRPGEDDDDWVALNARAFADHPEQGLWTFQDLRNRICEPWFDPAGFFLAERTTDDGRPQELLGFHWTKVHGGLEVHQHDAFGVHAHEGHGHDPIGEVYVLGVDPSAHGLGLGRYLTLVGLRHLRHLGLPAVMLYVDADNAPAIRLYTTLGFQRWDADLMFRRGTARRRRPSDGAERGR